MRVTNRRPSGRTGAGRPTEWLVAACADSGGQPVLLLIGVIADVRQFADLMRDNGSSDDDASSVEDR